MNKIKITSGLLCLALLMSFTSTQVPEKSKLIQLPIKIVTGFGPFNAGFAMHGWRAPDPASPWNKTEKEVTGTPADWTSLMKKSVWFDSKQFAYQNFKQGNLDATFFNELMEAWNIRLEKRSFSERPINCFVYLIYGKNKAGEIRYKIDTNNNLDFADEVEYAPAKMKKMNMDSLASLAPIVRYQSMRNGKVRDLTAPVLILEANGRILQNIPQHAEADFNGVSIKVCSQGFGSQDFEPASICIKAETPVIIEENEFITLNGKVYKNMGVNIDKEVLLLKSIPADSVIFSTQVGFYAKTFAGKEFTTQEAISLDTYKGKFLLLDFWGSWCGPCVQELPSLKQAYDKLDKSKIEFLGIANDQSEPLSKILQKEQIKWKQILCEKEEGVIDDYNIQGYPTTFLIDPSGKIVAKNIRGEKLLDSLNYHIKHWK